jgi:hypothetical protein
MFGKVAGAVILAVAFLACASTGAWAQFSAVNDTPPNGQEDTPYILAAPGVLANDTQPRNTVVLDADVANGVLTLNADGSFSYTPNANFNGADSFSYHFTYDGGTISTNVATVSLFIDPVNDAPVALDDNFAATAGVAFVAGGTGVLANDTDIDGPSLTAVLSSGPANGTLTLNANGTFTYTADAGFAGVDTFTYIVDDTSGGPNQFSGLATVSITVAAAPNALPVAVNDSYANGFDTVLSVNAALGLLANDTDADNDSLTAALVAAPASGALVLGSDGSFSFTPAAGFSGPVTFTYRANDGTGNSTAATVTIVVAAPPGNAAPVAIADTYATPYGTALVVAAAAGVLANDTDAESNSLTAAVVSAPASGALVLSADGGFSFTPAADFSGPATFTYRANDGSNDSAAATVTVTVGPAPGTINPATGQIQGFLDVRGGVLLPEAADAQPHIDRLNGTVPPADPGAVLGFMPMAFAGSATASASLNAIQAAAGEQQSRLDIWMKGTFGQFTDNSVEGLYGLGAAGVDYRVTSDLLLGGYIQLDQFNQNQTSGPGTITGTGWMAGPYATVRLGEGLYLDLKAAGGTSSNQISPLGTYTDTFSTTRWLLNAQLLGEIEHGDWTFYPGARVGYFQEDAAAYTDSLGATVPAVSSGLGQMALSPAVSYTLTTDGGVVMKTTLKVEGIADFAGNGGALAFTALHARVAPDLSLTFAGGATIRLSGYINSPATNGLQTMGAAIRLSAPLPAR